MVVFAYCTTLSFNSALFHYIRRQFITYNSFDIIPSSIHEVILIPDISCSREYIDEMIRDVNRRQLDPVDVLSDHVYMYRRDIGEIE